MNFLAWLGIIANGKPLDIGDVAPDAASRDEQGRQVRLAELYGDGFTFVYFYPKAGTPGCTAQACSLRDDYVALSSHGVRVMGVSSDSPGVQLHFKEDKELPFTLLSDQDHAVARAFGVPLMLGMARRQAFLIKGGHIVWRDLHAATREQAKDILSAVEALS